jgi:hypothetical protein
MKPGVIDWPRTCATRSSSFAAPEVPEDLLRRLQGDHRARDLQRDRRQEARPVHVEVPLVGLARLHHRRQAIGQHEQRRQQRKREDPTEEDAAAADDREVAERRDARDEERTERDRGRHRGGERRDERGLDGAGQRL